MAIPDKLGYDMAGIRVLINYLFNIFFIYC